MRSAQGGVSIANTVWSGVYWIALALMLFANHLDVGRPAWFDAGLVLIGAVSAVRGRPLGRDGSLAPVTAAVLACAGMAVLSASLIATWVIFALALCVAIYVTVASRGSGHVDHRRISMLLVAICCAIFMVGLLA